MAILENPYKLRPYNNVLVKTDKEFENIVGNNNFTLFKDTTYDPYRSKRIHGEVIAVPYKLRKTRIHQEDDQFPQAKTSFPGENIASQVKAYENRVGRRLVVKELKAHKARYCSSSYKPQFTSNNDQPMLASRGDTAWFHYLSLSDNSYVGQDADHNRYYQVPYESIFCFITKQGQTKMVNGYVQVTPYWDESYEDINVDGVIVKGKLKGNLVIGLKEAPEWRTGTITGKGLDFGQDSRRTLKTGDVVIYAKGSEFKNTINGKEVYLMQQWQIIAKKRGGTFHPVGDYVHLRVHKKPSGIIISLKDVIENKGEVIASGENCQYVQEGKTYIFNTKAEIFNLEDTIFIKEGQVIARYE